MWMSWDSAGQACIKHCFAVAWSSVLTDNPVMIVADASSAVAVNVAVAELRMLSISETIRT